MNLGEILGKVGFDWQVALANLVNFLVIFLLLKYFAFKPLSKLIQKRKEKIQKGLDDAQQAETNLMLAEEQASEITGNAKGEANTIIAGAQARVDDMLRKAEHDADVRGSEIMNDAHKKIEKERERMEQELRGQAADLVVAGVEKIMLESMNEKESEKLMVRALDMMRTQ